MKRISTILIFLTWCIVMYANHTESKGLAKAALAEIDGQIAHWQRLGDIEKELLIFATVLSLYIYLLTIF